LGTKTITCDNANAVKPFGAIDTPAQGGTVSGGSYVNFGWALTPQPYAIPTDGKTIDVYIDGVKVGNPAYNNYREDIATLFPGYANSNGAIGYFYLDTTGYSNGVHTIAWSVRDDGGNSDGVGSRYFSIENNGGDLQARYSLEQPKKGNRGQDSGSETDRIRLQTEKSKTEKYDGIRIKRGFNGFSPFHNIIADSTGGYVVKMKELERIEIHLPYDYISDVSTLPIGATLNRDRGIFYWQLGPGFLGEYRLRFKGLGSHGRVEPMEILIRVVTD
ncbi:MAG: hypothetical protein GY940_02210, partial [bacterium]|nr:hypothetical protein [bacterium]